mmetsp:Transcript_21575/g.49803  ORF Transcript_21575/g.49803 Transcript_21575/m.49803 type:complete len:568 (-) Transcript_21575:270-1973(-)
MMIYCKQIPKYIFDFDDDISTAAPPPGGNKVALSLLFAGEWPHTVPIIGWYSTPPFHVPHQTLACPISQLRTYPRHLLARVSSIEYSAINLIGIVVNISLLQHGRDHIIIGLTQCGNGRFPVTRQILILALLEFASKVFRHMLTHGSQILIMFPNLGCVRFGIKIGLFTGSFKQEKIDSLVPSIKRKDTLGDTASFDIDRVQVTKLGPCGGRQQLFYGLTHQNGDSILFRGTHHTRCHIDMRRKIRRINLVLTPDSTLHGPASVHSNNNIDGKGTNTSSQTKVFFPVLQIAVTMNASVGFQHSQESTIRKGLNTWQGCQLECIIAMIPTIPFSPQATCRHAPPVNALVAAAQVTALAIPSGIKHHIGGPGLFLMHLLKVSNSKDHQKGGSEILVALTRVSQTPSVDFIVHHLGHIVDQNHDIPIECPKLITKAINGHKAKQGIDPLSRHGGIEDNCLAILRSGKIGRNNSGSGNSPTFAQQIGNLGNGIDQLFRLIVTKLFLVSVLIGFIIAIFIAKIRHPSLAALAKGGMCQWILRISDNNFQHSLQWIQHKSTSIMTKDRHSHQT